MIDEKETITLEKILLDFNRYYAKDKIDFSLDILEGGRMYNIYIDSHNNIEKCEEHYEPFIRINSKKVGFIFEENVYKKMDILNLIDVSKKILDAYKSDAIITYRELLTRI